MDVAAQIANLLYERSSVSVPELGSFMSDYKPATIDHVQGRMQAPSKQLKFNSQQTLDDGLLLQSVKDAYQLSIAEAQKAIDAYVADVKVVLDRKEIVTIPKVGRLYRDYENNLRFLQDTTNFNTETFGLPVVQFFPVIRNEKTESTPKTGANQKKTGVGVPARIATWFQRNLIGFSSLTFVILLAGVYLVFFRHKPELNAAFDPNVPATRINISPVQSEPIEEPATNTSGTDDDLMDDTEAPTVSPNQTYCIIQIGQFGSEDNVKKLVQRIYDAGYEPYTEKAGNLTKVGIQFTYDDKKEIDKTLALIRKKFDKRAKVIKR